MKNLKYLMYMLVGSMLFISCAKEGPEGPQGVQGPQGPQGQTGQPGPSADVHEFTLTFGTSTTLQTFQMPSGSMYGKVTLVFLDTGFLDWVLLPYLQNSPGFVPVNYTAVCDELLERIHVRTDRGDNQAGSPWAVDNVQRSFRAVVLSTSSLQDYPDVDFANYTEVMEKFGHEE